MNASLGSDPSDRPVRDDRFERLGRAAHVLLEPLGDPVPPHGVGPTLARRMESCAAVADVLGIRSLNYLSALAGPHFRHRPAFDSDTDERGRAEDWISEVVAFCAGQIEPDDAPRLLQRLAALPAFAVVPPQFSMLIGDRLRADARRITQWRESALRDLDPPEPDAATIPPGVEPWPVADSSPATHQPAPVVQPPAPVAAGDPSALAVSPVGDVSHAWTGVDEPTSEVALPGAEAPAPASGVQTVARDELEMLAEAADALAAEAAPALLSLEIPASGDDVVAGWRALLDVFDEHLHRLVTAGEFVGLHRLTRSLESVRESVAAWGDAPARLDEEARRLLLMLPDALARYLRQPDDPNAAEFQSLLADPAWPAGAPAADVAVPPLPALQIVRTRQVASPAATPGGDDLSLEIPPQADRDVVQHLLTELPILAAAFSTRVRRLQGNDLHEAQRIAHTLKGSANTVGVRGIANLTHALEDLLLLIGKEGGKLSESLVGFLDEAADCLSEMCDAVAGLGPAPADATSVLARAFREIGYLLDATPEAGQQAGDSVRVSSRQDGASSMEPPWPADDRVPGTDESIVSAVVAPDTPVADDAAVEHAAESPQEWLRVPASLVDGLLELAGRAAVMLSQVHEQLGRLDETRRSVNTGSDRMQDLSSELERLVDIRGLALTERSREADFDPLELDEYNDLHTVARRIAESSADGRLVDELFDQQVSSMQDLVAKVERTQSELHDAALHMRMVPASSLAPRLERAVRQASRLAGKPAELQLVGDETEVDAQLLQSLVDPLTHLLRNAVDHGIETADERTMLGKPPAGRIQVRFERSGASLVIEVVDDGRGLDAGAILQRARALGWVHEGEAVSAERLASFVLQPGFSTRASATQLSGRGIGLDIVNRTVRNLRGSIAIGPAAGQGTRVRIQCPLAMALLAVTVARSRTHSVALSVRGVIALTALEQPAATEVVTDHASGASRVSWEGRSLPVFDLDELLGLPAGALVSARHRRLAMIVGEGDAQVAVVVPELDQARHVLVRPLPAYLPAVRGREGAAVLGDGSAVAVFDIPERLRALNEHGDAVAPLALPEVPAPPVCLVVDDSVSVRRATEAFMKDLGFEVDSASDGIDALGRLQERVPDLVVLDLEMPRMNGLELTRALRADPRTRPVPVVMITSRFSDRHRDVALAAGVDVYLTKPFSDDELAEHVQRCMLRRMT